MKNERRENNQLFNDNAHKKTREEGVTSMALRVFSAQYRLHECGGGVTQQVKRLGL
jgi:hypothetical protein